MKVIGVTYPKPKQTVTEEAVKPASSDKQGEDKKKTVKGKKSDTNGGT